ncbi:MAG: hypothetical protein H2057_00770 [Alphaproteobacteria bacterium]|nr:hypothetical protein [Alphaproteobacteria bacterium]
MMKKIMILGGVAAILAGCEPARQCGSPCPHLAPLAVPDETLLDAYHGSALGRKLSPVNQIRAARVLQDLLQTGELGEVASWKGVVWEDEGPSGCFRIFHKTYQGEAECIDYYQLLRKGVRAESAKGTACRDTQGVWHIIKEHPDIWR